MLLAFGLLLFALTSARTGYFGESRAVYGWLSGSGILLLCGYATRFLAEAFSGVKTAILQLDPRQVETARTLGAGRLRCAWDIVLPQVAPGTCVAAVLVVLAIMKELPVTLLLGGGMGLRTLSFRMYDRYQDAFYADAGLAGLLLVGLAGAALAISLRWRRHV